jgi:hypothetical protein
MCRATSALEMCICFIINGPAGSSWLGGRSFCCPMGAVEGSVLDVAVELPL